VAHYLTGGVAVRAGDGGSPGTPGSSSSGAGTPSEAASSGSRRLGSGQHRRRRNRCAQISALKERVVWELWWCDAHQFQMSGGVKDQLDIQRQRFTQVSLPVGARHAAAQLTIPLHSFGLSLVCMACLVVLAYTLNMLQYTDM
jgi:hypothetical protein